MEGRLCLQKIKRKFHRDTWRVLPDFSIAHKHCLVECFEDTRVSRARLYPVQYQLETPLQVHKGPRRIQSGARNSRVSQKIRNKVRWRYASFWCRLLLAIYNIARNSRVSDATYLIDIDTNSTYFCLKTSLLNNSRGGKGALENLTPKCDNTSICQIRCLLQTSSDQRAANGVRLTLSLVHIC